VSQYEEVRWLDELPSEIGSELFGDAGPGQRLFSIAPVVSEPPPEPPEHVASHVRDFDDSASDPELVAESQHELDDPAFRNAYEAWLDVWRVWAEHDRALADHRDWFEFLARLSRLLDQQDDEYEFVLGTGFLSWETPLGLVRHPILTTPLELASDPTTGRIDVTIPQNGVTRICDRTLLEHVAEFDSSRAEELRDTLRLLPAMPLADAAKDLLTQWRKLSLERARPYERTWDPPTAPTAAADLRFAPLVILRQRDRASLIDYYDRMLEHLSGPDAVAPLGLAQLVGALEPEVRLEWLTAEGSSDGEAIGSDPLFPLPANPEQLQVIDRLRRDNGVVVQGPPGTGKSHTIANLISALLARGQRVLVTSQKAQALRVLREKLPGDIQKLCVSMTDLSRGGSTELNESVTALSDRYATFSPAAHAQRVKAAMAGRDAARVDVSQLTEDIRVLRASETVVHPPISEGYEGTKSNIAERIRDEARRCSWIALPFPDDAPFERPLSIEEAVEVRRLLASATPEREARRGQTLPSLDSVPSAAEIASMIAAEAAASSAARRQQSDLSQALRPLDVAAFARLRGLVESASTALHDLRFADRSGSWVERALHDGLAGTEATVWSQLAQTSSAADHASAQLSWLGLRHVLLPNFDTSGPSSLSAQLAAGRALLAYLGAGHELKKRFRPAVQKDAALLLEECTIDGTPITNSDLLEVAITALDAEQTSRALTAQWSTVGVAVEQDLPLPRRIAQLCDLAHDLERVLAVVAARQGVEHELEAQSVRVALHTYAEWVDFVAALEAVQTRLEAERSTAALDDLNAQLSLRGRHPEAPPEVMKMANAIARRDLPGYDAALHTLANAFAEQAQQRRCDVLFERLTQAHPVFGDQLRRSADETVWDDRLAALPAAWAWGRARTFFDRLREPGREERLAAELDEAVARRDRATATVAAEEAWGQCLMRMNAHQEQALRAYQANISDRGAGTGRWAGRFAAAARDAMIEARGAVPAWIMPLREVVETIPPDKNSFDIVIIDEASQASIEALFLLWLAPRVIVVGDERQCAPSQVIKGELQPIFDRLDEYLADVPEYLRLAFTPKSNLFSLLATRFGSVIRLREHFRCMPEIISWSSRQFYSDAPLVPLRQFGSDRLPPLRCSYVSGAYTDGTATRLRNPLEAEAIVDAVRACCTDPAYEDKTFGVVVLQGTGQVRLIDDLLTAALPTAEGEHRRLRVGSPPDFQGDERDVMFVSMVIAERKPAVTHREWQRRFNVAASRARDQMWLFHSVTLDVLSPSDLRKSLLSYMVNPPAPLVIGRFDDLAWDSERRDPFDSKFEQRVYIALRDRGYMVTPQFEVNGRFIDLVITGARGRLAVECDGDHWHTSREDQLADVDRELQLRRAGWQFWRVRESEFYLDPGTALSGLWETLERRGIKPGDLVAANDEPMDTDAVWEVAPLPEEEGLDGLEGDDPAQLDALDRSVRRLRPIGPGLRRPAAPARSLFDAAGVDRGPSVAEVRASARDRGIDVGERGRLHPDVIRAWNTEHPERRYI
jgi:very-short-patch-repair endonuclease